jgi:hypothetical protein
MAALAEGSRELMFYVYDTEDEQNIDKRVDLDIVQSIVRKMNKKEPGRYKATHDWVIHKVRS